jgi:hypothetical protein
MLACELCSSGICACEATAVYAQIPCRSVLLTWWLRPSARGPLLTPLSTLAPATILRPARQTPRHVYCAQSEGRRFSSFRLVIAMICGACRFRGARSLHAPHAFCGCSCQLQLRQLHWAVHVRTLAICVSCCVAELTAATCGASHSPPLRHFGQCMSRQWHENIDYMPRRKVSRGCCLADRSWGRARLTRVLQGSEARAHAHYRGPTLTTAGLIL